MSLESKKKRSRKDNNNNTLVDHVWRVKTEPPEVLHLLFSVVDLVMMIFVQGHRLEHGFTEYKWREGAIK